MKDNIVKVKRLINAPAYEVYSAFTNATALTEWLCNAAQMDAHEGGRIYMWWNNGYYACGEFLTIEPGKTLIFSYRGRGEEDETRVKISIKAQEEGSLVTFTHTCLGKGKSWKEIAQNFSRGWETGLNNLKSVIETGQDLRFTRRPILGITASEVITPEIAEQHALPVQTGLRVDGVLEGSGLQVAGIQKDDILVKVAGQKVDSYPALFEALHGKEAGDQIKVVFYRHGVKGSTLVTLSLRPLPEVPATAEGLAAALQKMHVEAREDLERSLQGVTEAEASFQTAPAEWSAKEILAHLIATERDTHSWVASLIESHEAENPFHANLPLRVKALVAAYATLPGLLEELARNQAETVALVASLDADFVARKRTYWRLGYNLIEFSGHYQAHGEQIRVAIQAARDASSAAAAPEIKAEEPPAPAVEQPKPKKDKKTKKAKAAVEAVPLEEVPDQVKTLEPAPVDELARLEGPVTLPAADLVEELPASDSISAGEAPASDPNVEVSSEINEAP